MRTVMQAAQQNGMPVAMRGTRSCTPAYSKLCWVSWTLAVAQSRAQHALAGNPKDWSARIEAIAQAAATQLWVGLGGRDLDRQLQTMRLLGEQSMARFV